MPSRLSLSQFGLRWGAQVVLESVTLDIEAPGCTVLLGPSGTGKSTLLRSLAGVDDAQPTRHSWGRCCHTDAAGQALAPPPLVPQGLQLPQASIGETLLGPGWAHAGHALARLGPWLALAGCRHWAGCLAHSVAQCTPVEQRILAILRCVRDRSPLILVDEPSAQLAAAARARVLRLLQAVAAQQGVLVVLHNLVEAQRLAQHIVLLANGRVQEAGPAAAFFARPASALGRQFLATGSCPEAARRSLAPPFPIFSPPKETA